jgi:hypothetical protein
VPESVPESGPESGPEFLHEPAHPVVEPAGRVDAPPEHSEPDAALVEAPLTQADAPAPDIAEPRAGEYLHGDSSSAEPTLTGAYGESLEAPEHEAAVLPPDTYAQAPAAQTPATEGESGSSAPEPAITGVYGEALSSGAQDAASSSPNAAAQAQAAKRRGGKNRHQPGREQRPTPPSGTGEPE